MFEAPLYSQPSGREPAERSSFSKPRCAVSKLSLALLAGILSLNLLSSLKAQPVSAIVGSQREAMPDLDAGGYFWYVGRADDVFKSADYRISPFELESEMLGHAAVAETAVVASADPIRLAVPKVFVALKPGYAPSRELARELFRFIQQNIAPYKRPRRLEFVELPKTISGKIRRVELRQYDDKLRGSGSRGAQEYWESDFPELR